MKLCQIQEQLLNYKNGMVTTNDMLSWAQANFHKLLSEGTVLLWENVAPYFILTQIADADEEDMQMLCLVNKLLDIICGRIDNAY